MNRYIEQLVEDLKEAEEAQIAVRSHLDILGEAELYIVEDEDFCDGFNVAPLCEIIGFEKIVFPPHEQLTDSQIDLIYQQLSNLIENYNFFLDFPEKVQTRLKYTLLINALEDEYTCSNANITSIEFCDYDHDTCPFGASLCQCKIFEERS
ncbi:hypothetical protein CW751_00180 [Brumimicrobium salinarum]|uniref:Uncharacterized protein n=1 Tax=Brumimicrobium salinarum TaxID=2058658 RepID=A0A2I0R5D2_9FLAO|nr:hypothetical protein [Brumimicrobium salinarum]PKR81793.1 hypothetical protein CW751_00180 [Brumimicrobium salinarum]